MLGYFLALLLKYLWLFFGHTVLFYHVYWGTDVYLSPAMLVSQQYIAALYKQHINLDGQPGRDFRLLLS